MKNVAKLVIHDPSDHYLLLYRSNHPAYGDDPDLPGGLVEEGETLLEAVLREVEEEMGVQIDAQDVAEVYGGQEYSKHATNYALFMVQVAARPLVTLSWEHSTYEWLSRDEFLEKAHTAQDTYMHMVWDRLK